MIQRHAIAIAVGLGWLVFKVFVIVVPLLILLEWAKSQPWFARFIRASGRVFSPLGIRSASLFSLMTGVLFGISYGAGVLIPQAQSGEIDRRQIVLITTFLGLCHAVVEDTVIFAMVGASPWILISVRLAAAMLAVLVLSRATWPSRSAEPALEAQAGV